MPEMTCPRCHAELPDFDGFGCLAHTKPAYPDGCGYCSHPSRDDGVCGLCGDVKPAVSPMQPDDEDDDDDEDIADECDECDGDGFYSLYTKDGDPCEVCGGTGKLTGSTSSASPPRPR